MKILIIEDDPEKRDEFRGYLESLQVPAKRILDAKDMAEFMVKFDNEVGLCIIDLRLPAYEGAGQDNNGIGVLQAMDRAGAGHIRMLAISAYPEEFADIRAQFESRGCLLLDFKQEDVWKGVLKQMVLQLQSAESMDFIIFCALRSERAPYTGMQHLNGAAKFKDNLTRLDITIGGKTGTVIELPRMGLVDAAITAGQCIEKFKPRVVAMSGICAGFPARAQLGQLLIAELAYEYQSGKWSDDGFSQEPYQVPISEAMRVLARELMDDGGLLPQLERRVDVRQADDDDSAEAGDLHKRFCGGRKRHLHCASCRLPPTGRGPRHGDVCHPPCRPSGTLQARRDLRQVSCRSCRRCEK